MRIFRPIYRTVAFIALWLACAVPSRAVQKAPSEVPVTSTIADAVNAVNMNIQSDGNGPQPSPQSYANSKTVQSVIQGIGDWVLDTNLSRLSTRAIWLDFTDPVPGSAPNGGNPTAPLQAGLVQGRLISRCSLNGYNYMTMSAGTVICPLAISFSYAGNDYRITMNHSNYSDTNDVAVSCITPQHSWRVLPQAGYQDGTVKNTGKLLNVLKNGAAVDQGNFSFSFSIGITNP